ncbi:hypothetical protein Tco_1304133 [Tanacetum coccineum]
MSSVAKIKPSATIEGVPDVIEEESSESEAKSWGNDEDDNNNDHNSESDGKENEEDIRDDEEEVKDELVKTPSNDSDDEDETKITDKAEGDEDEEIDYTTSQLYDDVDIRLNEPVDTDKGFNQEEGTNAEITNIQQGNENSEISKVTILEKEVDELKKDPLKTQVTALVDEYLDARLVIQNMVTESLKQAVLAKESSQPQSSYEAAATLTEFELKKIFIEKMDKSESYLAAPEHKECYEGLIKSYDLNKTIFSTYGKVYSLKRSQKDKDKDKDPSAGSDRGLKKRKTSKDAEPTKCPKAKESQSSLSKGPKSQLKSLGKSLQSEEPEFEVVDSYMPQDQEGNLSNDDDEPMQETSKTFDELMSTPIDFSLYIMNGLKITNLTQETLLGPAFRLLKGTRSNYAELEYDFEECYKALSEKLDWENLKGGDYPFDLTKLLPLVMSGNHQKVPIDYFFNNDLKYLQGGVSTMTYMTSITKTKAAQYDLPGIEDMVEVMRKHGYRYLKEIVNQLTNLSGDDVSDFAIALRMFTRILVIQKRVEYLQLGVESYQKKINVTKPETTKSEIRKRDPYTPYQDPQGLIYVDNNGRNRLMRLDKLYKFSDRTLTRLRTLLDDITKNIQMEYMPKRRWSTLEKKRANIIIKAIDKQLKERRMMRSLKKFVGGRHYRTDLWLLQRTI